MKKKGFTLIELLGTIVIIAILAVVTVPIVNGIMERVRKASFKQNAANLLNLVKLDRATTGAIFSSGENTYTISKENNSVTQTNSGVVIDTEFTGEINGDGQIVVNSEGNMAIKYENSEYCAYKGFNDTQVHVADGTCSSYISFECGNANSISVTNENIWTQSKTVSFTVDNENCSQFNVEYSLDGSTYSSYTTPISVTTNGKIYFKTTNATGNGTQIIEKEIKKIDTSAPTFINVGRKVQTDSTLTVLVTAYDLDECQKTSQTTCNTTAGKNGIAKYAYRIVGENQSGEWSAWSDDYEHTFTGLHQGNYTVYVRAYNNTYGSDGALDANGYIESEGMNVTIVACATPQISITPSGDVWTQSKTVSISNIDSYNGTSCTVEYNYTYEGENTASEWINGDVTTTFGRNATVVARAYKEDPNYPSSASAVVSKVDTSVPTVSITTSKTTKSITVTALAYDEDECTKDINGVCSDNLSEKGISGYRFSKDNGATWSAWQESNLYTFNNLSSSAGENTYTVVAQVYNKTYGSVGAIDVYGANEASALVTLDSCAAPEISIVPSGWGQTKYAVFTDHSPAGYNFEYSLDGTTWQAVNGNLTVTENGINIIARSTDGVNTCGSATATSVQIDRTAPTSASLEVTGHTTNSITVLATGEDSQSGIYGYQFSKDGGVNWEPSVPQASGEYTFTGLTTNTYNVVARAINNAYNGNYNYDITNGTSTADLSIGTLNTNSINIELEACEVPTFSVSPSGETYALGKIVTIIDNSPAGYYTEYKVGNGDWTQGSIVDVTVNNTNIIARSTDGVNTCSMPAAATITMIDRNAPTNVSFTTTKTTKSIKITASAEATSGIYGYQFSTDGGTTWYPENAPQTSNEYVASDLSSTYQGTDKEYDIKVRAYTNAWYYANVKFRTNNLGIAESDTLGVTLDKCPAPTYTISDADKITLAKQVTINYGSVEGCTGTYQINGTSENGWVSGNSVVIDANNTQIVARNTDGTNTVTGAAQTIINIDDSAPTSLTFATQKTTKSITVNTIVAADSESNIYGYKYGIKGPNEADYTWYPQNSIDRTGEYTFDNLTTGTYDVSVKAYNNAYVNTFSEYENRETRGSITVAANPAITLNQCPVPTYTYPDNDASIVKQAKVLNVDFGNVPGCVGSYTGPGNISGNNLTGNVNVVVSANGSVIALNTDTTNTTTPMSALVGDIDESAPTLVSFTTSKTTNSITANVTNAVDSDSNIYGYAYAYSTDNENWTWYPSESTAVTETSHTFTGLATDTYYIKVRAFNNAWERTNVSYRNVLTGSLDQTSPGITLDACPQPTYEFKNNDANEWKQAKVLTLKFGNKTGCTGSYTGPGNISGSNLTGDVDVIVRDNGNITFYNSDTTNTVNGAALTITNIDTEAVTNLDFTTAITTNSVRLTPTGAVATASGIWGYEYCLDNDCHEQALSVDNTYLFSNVATTAQTTSRVAKVTAITNARHNTELANRLEGLGETAVTKNITMLRCPTPTFSYPDNDASEASVKQAKDVTITFAASAQELNGCQTYYTLPGGVEQQLSSGSSITVTATENGNLTARTADGTNNNTGAATPVVGIDRNAPSNVDFTYVITTNSVRMASSSGTATSGIWGYEYCLDNDCHEQALSVDNKYDFTNLNTQGKTTYNMSVTAITNAYKNTKAANQDATSGKATETKEDIVIPKCPTPTFSYPDSDASTWKQVKRVTINYGTLGECSAYYKLPSEDSYTQLQSGSSITVLATNNGQLAAYTSDGINNISASTPISNIDNTKPSVSFTIYSQDTKSVTISVTAADDGSDIYGYRFGYSTDGGTTYTWKQANQSNAISKAALASDNNRYTFNNLSTRDTQNYKFAVEAINNAYVNTLNTSGVSSYADSTIGINTATSDANVTIEKCTAPVITYSPSASTYDQSKTVTINFGSTNGCSGSYTMNKKYQTGEVVYYNPITNDFCNNYLPGNSDTGYMGNANTSTQNGCLKWYAYLDNDTSTTVKLLLDHNTTERVAWHSSSNVALEDSTNIQNALGSLRTTGGWTVAASDITLISAADVATIVGYQNFNSTNNTLFYFDSKNNTTAVTIQGGSAYTWLFDNTGMADWTCTSYGCNSSNTTNSAGYWTSTPYGTTGAGSDMWHVSRYGALGHLNAYDANRGIRPVITVDKSKDEAAVKIGSSLTGSTSFTVAANGLVTATNTDGVNPVQATTNVLGVDTTIPTGVAVASVNAGTSTITVTAMATDLDSGIYGYQFSKDNGATWQPANPQASNTYTYSGIDTTTSGTAQSYNIKVRAYNNAWNNASSANDSQGMKESVSTSVSMKKCPTPTFSFPDNDASTWKQTKRVTINYGDLNGCSAYYTLPGGSEQTLASGTSTTVTITENGNIVARTSDGLNEMTAAAQPGYVDVIAPSEVEITSVPTTTNTITINASSANTTSASGIYGYQFSIDNGTTWEPANPQSSNTYTFTGVNSKTVDSYTVKVKAYNNAWYNTASASRNDALGSVESTSIVATMKKCPTPVISEATPSGYAPSKSVTITFGNSTSDLNGCSAYYTLPGGSKTELTGAASTTQTVTSNGNVIAETNDGTNIVTASRAVTGLDTTAPVIGLVTATGTTRNITLSFTVTDTDSGITSVTCDYGTDTNYGTNVEATNTSDNNYTCTFNNDLSAGQNYSYRVNATNGAGTPAVSAGTTATAAWATITFGIDPSDWSHTKTITINGTQTGATLQYQLGSTSGTWTTYTAPFSLNYNTTIYARLNDGLNTSQNASLTISKIVNQAGQISYSHATYTNGETINSQQAIEDLYNKLNNATNTYYNGQVVYYNPLTNTACSNYLEGNSDTGYMGNASTSTQNGCLKWYAYLDSDSSTTVKLLLDHNTTAQVAWNTDGTYGTNVALEDSTLIQAELASLKTTGGWNTSLTPTIISAYDVATIVGKTDFTNTSDWFYLDSKNQVDHADSTNKSAYAWLFDNTGWNDSNGDCTNYGCNYSNTLNSAGYWTSTPYGTASEGSYVWHINRGGHLSKRQAYRSGDGVRPVITVYKSILSA